MKEKKKGEPRTKKTSEELVTQHRAKIEHEVTRITEWCDKLVKSIGSHKYRLTEMELQSIINAVNDSYQSVVSATQPTLGKPSFKL